MKIFVLRHKFKDLIKTLFWILIIAGFSSKVDDAWVDYGNFKLYHYFAIPAVILLVSFGFVRIFQYLFPTKIIFEEDNFRLETTFNTKIYNYQDSRIVRIAHGGIKFDKIYDSNKKSYLFDTSMSNREFMEMYKYFNLKKLQKELS